MATIQDFNGVNPTWCSGCGNHGIGIALKLALTQMNLDPSQIAMVFGIGCSGNMADFINVYALHSLHGRAIPNAIGIKLANHKLPVFVIAGDGDTYGEGGNHFLHACRGNHDIKLITHCNSLYGLTTGQTAPTSQKGFRSKSTPEGSVEIALNPLIIALYSGATFIAQAYAGDTPQIIEILKKGIEHKGFVLINILQPCVTFNKINTYQYYKDKVYKLPADYDKTNFDEAIKKANELSAERYPLGVIYETNKPTFTDQLSQLQEKALIDKERFTDFSDLIKEFI